ncbi:MAG: rhodanese-like domain-containing protein [Lentimicrobium sp.]|nr:rhodanese-like domain-containing protein [Lentimicrobium sp.]
MSFVENLGSKEAYELLVAGDAVLLDVRALYLQDFKCFDVPRCLQIPAKELIKRATDLSKDVFYICADSAGIFSKNSAQTLLDAGFIKAGNLAGGLVDWELAGLPVRTDIDERFTGSCMCQLKKRAKKL